MSVFKESRKNGIPAYVKDFIVERIQEGELPNKIKAKVKMKYDLNISLMAVGRVRKQYIRITKKHLKAYHEFHCSRQYKIKK
jgi:hypothetical protein